MLLKLLWLDLCSCVGCAAVTVQSCTSWSTEPLASWMCCPALPFLTVTFKRVYLMIKLNCRCFFLLRVTLWVFAYGVGWRWGKTACSCAISSSSLSIQTFSSVLELQCQLFLVSMLSWHIQCSSSAWLGRLW